ncbi:elongation factor P [Enterobacteriaceae endosymbiont of Neohaemonia nigricornis]|uniref:elongation factor P n=1 Tax=Enterobacteriaceae endosymbiont of Neohaemonia nigricornis TaxID=2675792 RepID=UPI0014490D7D|nr:elongation factor P [Enterobacteriaceae endosymbiont of Neohaemonia nigricornis]QJC30371.1 elongation factor P [Enterobacteriaceae endosymbiont of Neohaemonia nigricornis]
MINYFSNNFKVGMKFIFLNEPYIIEKSEFIKPGKGQTFTRIKMRNLITEKLLDKTFKSTEHLNTADIFEHQLIYLYCEKNYFYHFMFKKTFEQIMINNNIIKNKIKWLLPQYNYNITFWNKLPIFLTLPNFINLNVIKTNIIMKNSTINNMNKQAILSNGEMIKVPNFINIGDTIKIDIRKKIYVSRIK